MVRYTRGNGILENYLVKYRSRLVNKLIPSDLRKGTILDLGCGQFPYFLINTSFNNKYGLDLNLDFEKINSFNKISNIRLIKHDLNDDFPTNIKEIKFDVITILAVIDQIQPKNFSKLFGTISKILNDDGLLIITNPTMRGKKLLNLLKKIKIVSEEEISTEQISFNELSEIFSKNNIPLKITQNSKFQFGLNEWALMKRIHIT